MTLITNIAEAIKAQKTDEELNIIIQDFINEWSEEMTVEEWRLANYSDLRRWAYPDYTIYLDAIVKINCNIQDIQLNGQEQLDQYYQDCMAVKERFPKN